MAVGIAHSKEVMQILALAWYLFKELTQERRFALRFSTTEHVCVIFKQWKRLRSSAGTISILRYIINLPIHYSLSILICLN